MKNKIIELASHHGLESFHAANYICEAFVRDGLTCNDPLTFFNDSLFSRRLSPPIEITNFSLFFFLCTLID